MIHVFQFDNQTSHFMTQKILFALVVEAPFTNMTSLTRIITFHRPYSKIAAKKLFFAIFTSLTLKQNFF